MRVLKKILFTICLFILFSTNIKAAYFDVSVNATTVTVGQTVKVTVSFNSYEAGLNIYSSNNSVLSGGVVEDWVDKSSYVTYFTAKSAGNATITINATGTTMDSNNEQDKNFNRSINIKVVSKSSGGNNSSINVNPIYSKNNYLEGLSVEGYDLEPKFDKEILEYKVELNPGVDKININASKEDNKASIKGDGEVSITEGINIIEIVVTAENGNERIYKIIANSPEKDPINIKLNKKNYTVVKRKELLQSKDGYSEITVKIKDFDIPALYNEVTKVTLVGLKDEEGNIKLYSYDSSKDEYNEYKEFSFDLMNLYIHENKKSKYEKINININDNEVIGYKLEGIDDYCLIYATNTNTGYEGYYLYDTKENSVQRYDSRLLDKLTQEKDKYLSLVLVLSSVCFLSMLFLLIVVNRDNKRKNEE